MQTYYFRSDEHDMTPISRVNQTEKDLQFSSAEVKKSREIRHERISV